jgi:phospholipase C
MKIFFILFSKFILLGFVTVLLARTTVYAQAGSMSSVKTIFLILMENHNWSQVNTDPNIKTLLTQGAHAEQYYSPTGIHPSEPNYIWLEAGTNLGITNDNNPSSNHQSTTAHLVTLLKNAGISWKAYEEDITGTVCPLTAVGKYAPKHSGMIFFDDVTGTNNPNDPYCIAHYRPYAEFLADLSNNSIARYNFLTPNLCNDMHDCSVATGGQWLGREIPKIMASQAYKNNGAIFITWDENEGGNFPIGMIVLSPLVKTPGYVNSIHYDHSSMLKSAEEILQVNPLLGHAADASTNDLSALFSGSGPGGSTTTTPKPTPTLTPTLTFTSTPTSVTQPTPTPTLANKAGDANADGLVNETDYSIWISHAGMTLSSGMSVGDFDGNGVVDGVDYTIWLRSYGM